VWRLLLVDDNESVREVLRLYADGRGLTIVAETGDGDAALVAAERHRPHAVVIDEEMPGRRGLEVVPLLAERLPDAVIVLYTARRGIARRARAAGADAHFDKRVPPREVIAGVVELLETRGPRRGRFPRVRPLAAPRRHAAVRGAPPG